MSPKGHSGVARVIYQPVSTFEETLTRTSWIPNIINLNFNICDIGHCACHWQSNQNIPDIIVFDKITRKVVIPIDDTVPTDDKVVLTIKKWKTKILTTGFWTERYRYISCGKSK